MCIREIRSHAKFQVSSLNILELNPTLYGGALSAPPKVLFSGAFQSDLMDPKCWHNSYSILRIIFLKKKFQHFFNFFFIFFSLSVFLGTQKDFLHFWAKHNLLLYTWRATCPFDPPKVLFRGLTFGWSTIWVKYHEIYHSFSAPKGSMDLIEYIYFVHFSFLKSYIFNPIHCPYNMSASHVLLITGIWSLSSHHQKSSGVIKHHQASSIILYGYLD